MSQPIAPPPHEAPPSALPDALKGQHGPALIGALGLAGAILIAQWLPPLEGTRLTTYADIGGVLTACTGHTGADVKAGARYSRAQCADLLASDLVVRDAQLSRCLRRDVPVHMRAALLSWGFNVGMGAACGSTVMRLANAGQFSQACAGLEQWVWVAGRDCRLKANASYCGGIVTRRAAERALCEGTHPAYAAAAASAAALQP